MIYLGNGIYSESGPDTMSHYGVLGMKWGIRKDQQYRSDLNWHRANKKIRAAKARQASGEITKKQRKAIEREIVKATKAKNAQMLKDPRYKMMKPIKGKEAKSIFTENEKKALATIPHYKAKHIIRKAIDIAATTAAGVSVGAAASVPALGLATGGMSAAQAAQVAGMYGASAAEDLLAARIGDRIIRGHL